MFANDFLAPTELSQACSLLSREADQTVILAGGTNLMARFNRRLPRRKVVIAYLGRLGLDYIRVNGGQVIVGACATLSDIAASKEIRRHLPLLGRTCGEMACPAVRNAATLGGNVANGARNADGTAALVALGARVVVASTAGEKKMPIEQFIMSPKIETLKNGGLIKEFEIPALDADEKWGWDETEAASGGGAERRFRGCPDENGGRGLPKHPARDRGDGPPSICFSGRSQPVAGENADRRTH